MKKSELVSLVAKETSLSQRECEIVIDAYSAVVLKECIGKGEDIPLFGVGRFKQKVNEARVGFNPSTLQPLDVKASKTVCFKVSSSVKVYTEPVVEKKKVKAKVEAPKKGKK